MLSLFHTKATYTKLYKNVSEDFFQICSNLPFIEVDFFLKNSVEYKLEIYKNKILIAYGVLKSNEFYQLIATNIKKTSKT